jgi:hypothetical protein
MVAKKGASDFPSCFLVHFKADITAFLEPPCNASYLEIGQLPGFSQGG